tara:strand:- start:3077 stop:4006 length:930 start_codon:yes stop_codon:yes gene_type:complete
MNAINSNITALFTANALSQNQRVMTQVIERLSTGKRINSAADDPAGIAIASRMTSQIRGLNQAVSNTNDGISMLKTADGALSSVSTMLQRMRELTVQAATGTNTNAELTSLNTEFEALESEINTVATNTQWNGTNLLDGSLGTKAIQVGANANQTISITFADLNTDFGNAEASQAGDSGGTTAADLDIFTNLAVADPSNNSGVETVDLAAQVITGGAQATTLSYLDTAIARVSAHRATLGATMNRFEFAVDNLTNVSQNTSVARSHIEDADYAQETARLARAQIIQQAGIAMLVQANQQAGSVLSLLKQ